MDLSKIAILNQSLQGPLGSIIGALIILAIGWFVAGIIRRVLAAALAKTKLDSKLSSEAGIQPISGIIADLIYWFILLIVLTMVVGRLGLNGLFTPLTNMIDKIFAFMPNAMLAGFVMFIGFIVAKIVRSMVTTVVSRLNIQALVSKAGVDSKNNLPNIAGSVVFLLTIVPFTIAALDALKVESISRPATNMLNKVMESLPNVFTALAVLVVTFLVVRLVADVIKGLVANTQLDDLPNKIGLQNVLGTKKLSDVIGCGVLVFAMLFAIIAAADLLGFGQISDIVTMFIAFGSQIILGAVILTIGFWLANLIAGVVERSEQGSKFLANIVRVLIMGLVLAMGLKAMGIADSIVNLAFGLTLGAVAVAFALSFGLGGQEAAARYLRRLQDKLEKNDE
ncbi:mechanosensitive ion channel [uncultured Moraxella sp.]|uniref:mechanosensitive ion channel n=1 Tax=uncultured Moraxella sp. TaxID=263769 RepID=UPI0025FECAF0|nr:mechanosensitive ion channel [uncultured Moraxella sp.]